MKSINSEVKTKQEQFRFVDGLIPFKPKEQAPKWVVANILILTEQFEKYMKDNTNPLGELRVDILQSKDGRFYTSLYTPKSKNK